MVRVKEEEVSFSLPRFYVYRSHAGTRTVSGSGAAPETRSQRYADGTQRYADGTDLGGGLPGRVRKILAPEPGRSHTVRRRLVGRRVG